MDPSSAVIVRDTPMDLGGGSNTDGTGIGDSRYATDAQPRSAGRSLSPCADPTFSSLPALPHTMTYRSPSRVDAALLRGLEDIRSGDAVPLSSSPSSSCGSVVSSSDSDDGSMVDGCRVDGLVGGKETYGSLEEVAADIQRLGKQQNNCLEEIISLKGEIKLLKAVIARLEGYTVAHKAELTIGRGEPVWSSRENIWGSVRAEAAKRMNGGVTASLPPADVRVASSSGSKKVAFDESPDTDYVVVDRKDSRGRRANRRRRNKVAGPAAAAYPAPVPVPAAVPASSLPTGAAMYGRVAAAPPPPPVPYTTRPGRQVRSRMVASSPAAVVNPGPSRTRVPTSSPSPDAHERQVTMGFDAGKQTQLLVTPKAIRIRMNQTLSNLGKVSDKTPYIREARSKLEIGCIYLKPAEHTAGRPNMLGSVFAMKQAGAASCGIRFTVDRNVASDGILSPGRVFLFGKYRNSRFFEEYRSALVCNKFLQVGHVEMLCAFPPGCRFCFGDHLSKSHRCGQLNCPGENGQSCCHTVRRCMLC